MNWINKLFNILNIGASKAAKERWDLARELANHPSESISFFRSQEWLTVESDVPGAFTMQLGDQAAKFLDEHLGLKPDEILSLPQRVYNRCVELGFGPAEPIHFMLEIVPEPEPKNVGMRVAKIVPPIHGDDKVYTRTIVLYAPTVLADIEEQKKTWVDMAAMDIWSDRDARAALQSSILEIVRTNIKTVLSHEMVHIFATDEWNDSRKILERLGLDDLELLTDSINVDTFYHDYRKKNYFIKGGFAEGAGYLLNLLGRELGPNPMIAVEIVKKAKAFIKECQQKLKIAAQPPLNS